MLKNLYAVYQVYKSKQFSTEVSLPKGVYISKDASDLSKQFPSTEDYSYSFTKVEDFQTLWQFRKNRLDIPSPYSLYCCGVSEEKLKQLYPDFNLHDYIKKIRDTMEEGDDKV